MSAVRNSRPEGGLVLLGGHRGYRILGVSKMSIAAVEGFTTC